MRISASWFVNVGSEFTGIKNELTTYLGRLYTKEFFYLFTEGKYYPNIPQFILLDYFDNVIWKVEQLQKNDFLFFESKETKKNNEETLEVMLEKGKHMFSDILLKEPK